MNRCIRAVLLIAIVLMAVGAGGGSGLRSATAADIPLDLAALALRPADLEAPGFARFNAVSCGDPAGCASALFSQTGPNEAELAVAKARRGYSIVLGAPNDAGDLAMGDVVEMTMLEFADSAKARTGLDLTLRPLADAATPMESDTLPDAQLFVVERSVGGNPNIEATAGIRFRSGRLVVSIMYGFDSANDLDPSTVETLAEIVRERIDHAADAPGLGALVVRHLNVSYDMYDFIDGEIQPSLTGTDDARAAEYAAIGATNVYISYEEVLYNMLMYPSAALRIALIEFETEADAGAYLTETMDKALADTTAAQPLDGALALGDQSAAIVYANEYSYSVQYIIRVGTVDAVISWDDPMARPGSIDEKLAAASARFANVAAFTAAAQADCLTASVCDGLQPIPDELLPVDA